MSNLDVSRLQQQAYRRAIRDCIAAVDGLHPTVIIDNGMHGAIRKRDVLAALRALDGAR